VASDCLNLIVSDNGQGIDAAYHHRIFDMYFRANERSKGNGLGLYITKKAVEKLNGEISFESAAGHGCVFKVIVPSGEKLLS
jgi:signal transduction histidine kinase